MNHKHSCPKCGGMLRKAMYEGKAYVYCTTEYKGVKCGFEELD